MTSGTSDGEVKQCKSCKEPIEEVGVMLHGRFPMHQDCYLEAIHT